MKKQIQYARKADRTGPDTTVLGQIVEPPEL